MYNDDRKLKFINETRATPEFGESIFRSTEKYEKKAGRDLCSLPRETLQKIANENFGTRSRTLDSAIAFIRSYVVWCEENGYEVSQGIYHVNMEVDQKMKRSMVSSPFHLESLLNLIFDPVSDETTDCLYRCYAWMAFAGIEEAEAVNITVDEVDFDQMVIEHDGRSYDIYREAIPAFKFCCNATQFRYNNPLYRDELQGKYRNRFLGRFLMRGIRSEQIKSSTARAAFIRYIKKADLQITYGKLRLSGLFYKTFEMERTGFPVNFNSEVSDRVNKNEHTYHKNYTRNKLANGIQRDLMTDYAFWKAAFSK